MNLSIFQALATETIYRLDYGTFNGTFFCRTPCQNRFPEPV